ncbi:MAG: agmatinase, partial [Gemmatimonadetes bacterium]|nr:agmatinase [Gemmatimonadota bacterium]
ASKYVEWYDEELDREPHEIGVCTLPAVELSMAGPETAIAELRALYDNLLAVTGDRLVIGLGGEHSVSSAPATAWLDRLEGDVTILQFDAHTDLRDRYHGTAWNHACVARRVLETSSDVVFAGIRALTIEERDVIREHDLTVVYAHEMRRGDWVRRLVDALGENVYITFDVDFFDPALMPATGTPEPGGGDWWDAMDALSAVFRERNVVGVDVVELSPRGGEEASAFTAAKLVYKMIGFWSESR